jgi:hypothetical protein
MPLGRSRCATHRDFPATVQVDAWSPVFHNNADPAISAATITTNEHASVIAPPSKQLNPLSSDLNTPVRATA